MQLYIKANYFIKASFKYNNNNNNNNNDNNNNNNSNNDEDDDENNNNNDDDDDDDDDNINNNNGNAFSVQCILSSFCHELLVTPTKSNLLSLVAFN